MQLWFSSIHNKSIRKYNIHSQSWQFVCFLYSSWLLGNWFAIFTNQIDYVDPPTPPAQEHPPPTDLNLHFCNQKFYIYPVCPDLVLSCEDSLMAFLIGFIYSNYTLSTSMFKHRCMFIRIRRIIFPLSSIRKVSFHSVLFLFSRLSSSWTSIDSTISISFIEYFIRIILAFTDLLKDYVRFVWYRLSEISLSAM